jgi:hypothetical protein
MSDQQTWNLGPPFSEAALIEDEIVLGGAAGKWRIRPVLRYAAICVRDDGSECEPFGVYVSRDRAVKGAARMQANFDETDKAYALRRQAFVAAGLITE